MADFRAIHALTQAMIQLLQASYVEDDFNNELQFRVFSSRDFSNPMANGVSLFLYRIFSHGSNRSPAGRVGPSGNQLRNALPVEVHFMFTVWAGESSLQHMVAGWLMRTMEDNALLPNGLLNAAAPGAFAPNETVEIALAELPTEDLLRIWEALDTSVFQLSIPYLARVISIDSTLERLPPDTRKVQDQLHHVGVLEKSL